jgi:hypothetical protein
MAQIIGSTQVLYGIIVKRSVEPFMVRIWKDGQNTAANKNKN